MEPEASKLVKKSKLDSQINAKRFMLELRQYSCPEQTTDIHVLQEEPKSNLQISGGARHTQTPRSRPDLKAPTGMKHMRIEHPLLP